MWLFTKYGYFSAVCARQGDGTLSNAPDPNKVMVRARDRKHLEALIAAYPDDFPAGLEIKVSPNNDYRFRVFLPKPTWAKIVCELVLEMDYDNFKSKASQTQGPGSEYVHCLHRVWGVMYGYQEGLYGAGLYSRKSIRDVFGDDDDADDDLDDDDGLYVEDDADLDTVST